VLDVSLIVIVAIAAWEVNVYGCLWQFSLSFTHSFIHGCHWCWSVYIPTWW